MRYFILCVVVLLLSCSCKKVVYVFPTNGENQIALSIVSQNNNLLLNNPDTLLLSIIGTLPYAVYAVTVSDSVSFYNATYPPGQEFVVGSSAQVLLVYTPRVLPTTGQQKQLQFFVRDQNNVKVERTLILNIFNNFVLNVTSTSSSIIVNQPSIFQVKLNGDQLLTRTYSFTCNSDTFVFNNNTYEPGSLVTGLVNGNYNIAIKPIELGTPKNFKFTAVDNSNVTRTDVNNIFVVTDFLFSTQLRPLAIASPSNNDTISVDINRPNQPNVGIYSFTCLSIPVFYDGAVYTPGSPILLGSNGTYNILFNVPSGQSGIEQTIEYQIYDLFTNTTKTDVVNFTPL
ncbi:MAG: hypothetical protein QM528_02060 [Phycisphaerales bacterium]|nr:hypothetical protein [Phycisphaerales bacterium]